MIIIAVKVRFYAPWVHSLKEKRMVVKSLISKIRNKFNVSISEIESQDVHQTIVIGAAAVAECTSMADSIIDNLLDFIEKNTEAQIVSVERDFR